MKKPTFLLLVIIVLYFILQACSQGEAEFSSPSENQSDNTHIIFLNDVTTSISKYERGIQHTPEENMTKLKSLLPYEEDIWRGVIVDVGVINSGSLPELIRVELEPVTSVLEMRRESRRRDIVRFESELFDALTAADRAPLDSTGTSIHRSVCFLIGMLKRSDSNNKFLVLGTDGLEVTPNISFEERYNTNPERIREDYDSIARVFSEDCRIETHSNVHVIISHKNLPMTRTRNEAMFWFWEKYLTEYGGCKFTLDPYMQDRYEM